MLIRFLLTLAAVALSAQSLAADLKEPPYDPYELVRKLSPGLESPETEDVKQLKVIFEQAEDKVDYARALLAIDKMVDPAIDVDANLKKIDSMVDSIRRMNGPGAKDWDKMLALRRYLYEKGSWNNNRSFQYDFNDPLGTKIWSKLIPNYMATREGNCVSMPFLFIVLGQKIGLDVRASTAPLHVFVKYRDADSGQIYNLEATSGANPTRDEWYRQRMPMTDQAVSNGLYLQRLTVRETLVVMSAVLAEHRLAQGQYEAVIALDDLSLKYYPKDVGAMLRKGTAHHRLLKKHFLSKYRSLGEVPPEQREYFRQLSDGNGYWFAKAETLGWREPTQESEEKYKRTVEQAGSAAKQQ